MAARKPKKADAYQVVGAAAVIRKGKNERYLDRGAIVLGEDLDDANAAHLVAAGLIEEYELPKPDGENPDTGTPPES